MFRLWSNSLLPDDQIQLAAYFEWERHPERPSVENWNVAAAGIVADRVRSQLRELDPAINEAILRLCREACLGGAQWDAFYTATWEFLSRSGGESDKVTGYFRNLTALWTPHARAGRFVDGDALWRAVMTGVQLWEGDHGTKVHKGAGFYFWALNQILAGNLHHGFLLMHEALAEDIRTYGAKPFPKTPAAAFCTLDSSAGHLDDLARRWLLDHTGPLNVAVRDVAAKISAARVAPKDKSVSQPPAALEDLRHVLMGHMDPPDRMYLLTYGLAMFEQVLRDRAHLRHDRFASQLIEDAILNLATFVEKAAGHTRGTENMFGGHVRWLSEQRGGVLRTTASPAPGTCGKKKTYDLADALNDAFDASPEQVTGLLLDGKPWPGCPTNLGPFDPDLGIAWVLRNRAAHDPLPLPVLWRRADEIRGALLRVLVLSC